MGLEQNANTSAIMKSPKVAKAADGLPTPSLSEKESSKKSNQGSKAIGTKRNEPERRRILHKICVVIFLREPVAPMLYCFQVNVIIS